MGPSGGQGCCEGQGQEGVGRATVPGLAGLWVAADERRWILNPGLVGCGRLAHTLHRGVSNISRVLFWPRDFTQKTSLKTVRNAGLGLGTPPAPPLTRERTPTGSLRARGPVILVVSARHPDSQDLRTLGPPHPPRKPSVSRTCQLAPRPLLRSGASVWPPWAAVTREAAGVSTCHGRKRTPLSACAVG